MAGQQRDDDRAGDRKESDETVAMSATARGGTQASPGSPEVGFPSTALMLRASRGGTVV
ncbi:hypothetical protein [Streptomyces sp. NPDC012508]|uniref:hypothetical protein n=1 Tax=Streptomyces sp. NPDC012508 TaxID=3364837 RepID=UPI0036C421FF